MQDTQVLYTGDDLQPVEQEQDAEKTANVRKVVLAVLTLALGVIAGLTIAWIAGRSSASEPAAMSPEFVTSSTPSEEASPTVTTPDTRDEAAVTPAGNSGGSEAGGSEAGGSGHVADNTPPGAPELLSPSDDARVTSGDEITLQWSKVTDPSGVRYNVQIQQWAGGGAGWGTISQVKGLTSRHHNLTVGALRERWRVIAEDRAGNVGRPSEWRTIVPVSRLQMLRGSEWRLVAISDGAGGMLDPLDGTHPGIRFDSSSVSGRTGVNSFSGTYTATEDGAMSIGSLTSTMMSGSADAMRQEAFVTSALSSTARWRIENDGKMLTLLTASDGELAVFAWSAD